MGLDGPPSDPVKKRLLRLYNALEERFGPQHWWPGHTAYEIAAGAILTQHTAWRNAARALTALRRQGLLSPERVVALGEAALATVIRPAGTYRAKARALLGFTGWLIDHAGGRFGPLRRAPLDALRRDMLDLRGLGPETVDSILLYAAHRPVFVADGYARRVLVRHRLLASRITYEEARLFVEAHLPSDPSLFNELHALIVAVGKKYCRTVPLCAECPLRFDLRGRRPAPSS